MKPAAIIPNRSVPARRYFLRAAFAEAQREAQGSLARASFFRDDDQISPMILDRAAVSPASTTVSGWAAELVTTAWRDFLIDLAPYSGAARLIELAVPATLGVHGEAKYPVRLNGRAVPAWAGENDAIPVISGEFNNVEIGPARKIASIVAWSRETGQRSDARAIFETMLREDTAAGLDSAFFATTAGSSTAHAGLLHGVAPLTGYPGDDEFALKKDLMALAETVADGGSGAVTFIMNPKRVARLKIMAPAIVAVSDIVASTVVPVNRMIAADGASLLVSVDKAPDISASASGVLHMNTVPEQISTPGSPATVAAPVRSLWQTASTALRVIHDMAFAKRRPGAVAYLDDAGW